MAGWRPIQLFDFQKENARCRARSRSLGGPHYRGIKNHPLELSRDISLRRLRRLGADELERLALAVAKARLVRVEYAPHLPDVRGVHLCDVPLSVRSGGLKV